MLAALKKTGTSPFAWILEDARAHFQTGMNWTDFSRRYFEPGSPRLPSAPEVLRAYMASPEFREIREMKCRLAQRHPHCQQAPQGTAAVDLGRLSIKVPKSLHRILAEEAGSARTSLDKLIQAKLARPLW